MRRDVSRGTPRRRSTGGLRRRLGQGRRIAPLELHEGNICLGRALAQIELQIVFATLARRIPTLRLAVPLAEVPFKNDENLLGAHALR